MTSPSLEYISSMRTRIDELVGGFVGEGEPYALLDWPDYSNVGDSAIWLGTSSALTRASGRPPSLVTRLGRFPDTLDRDLPEGSIFLTGGGNFGDVWTDCQERRIALLERLPGRTIVQLSQSVFFADPKAADATARAIEAHGRFTLVVRDRRSFDWASARFACPVVLAPDMAFALGPISAPVSPREDVICLARGDRERRPDFDALRDLAPFGPVVDWPGEPRHSFDRLLSSMARRLADLSATGMAMVERVYHARAESRLRHGLEILARGDCVVTDRLHGHILSVLMGKPHLVYDNSYGKIGDYIETWPGDGTTTRARDAAEVRRILEERAAETGRRRTGSSGAQT